MGYQPRSGSVSPLPQVPLATLSHAQPPGLTPPNIVHVCHPLDFGACGLEHPAAGVAAQFRSFPFCHRPVDECKGMVKGRQSFPTYLCALPADIDQVACASAPGAADVDQVACASAPGQPGQPGRHQWRGSVLAEEESDSESPCRRLSQGAIDRLHASKGDPFRHIAESLSKGPLCVGFLSHVASLWHRHIGKVHTSGRCLMALCSCRHVHQLMDGKAFDLLAEKICDRRPNFLYLSPLSNSKVGFNKKRSTSCGGRLLGAHGHLWLHLGTFSSVREDLQNRGVGAHA